MTTTTTTTAASSEQQRTDLFGYTEEELLQEGALTYYEILNVAVHAGPTDIKKAYRKSSLKYHPDKTGRGDDDYVFLAVKAAYDTLSDHSKRQAYDSTVLPFDDAIPAARSPFASSSSSNDNNDNGDDFFDRYRPVFERNLRFDARLRPDLKGPNSSSNNGNGKSKNKKQSSSSTSPPSLGDADTPLPDVHTFYEYWIHFESWRDFSSTAADELQVENELENAESRFEKRWIQKEIDKRARQLKRTELGRISTLVERAMEEDPRLRAERQALVAAKEAAAQERLAARERERVASVQEAEAAVRRREEEKVQRAQDKVEREKEKKRVRKARQQLRKWTVVAYNSAIPNSCGDGASGNGGSATKEEWMWNDAYDMGQDVEVLCTKLDLEELLALNEEYEALGEAAYMKGLRIIHERTEAVRNRPDESSSTAPATPTNGSATNGNDGATVPSTVTPPSSNKPNVWTAAELSALAKAVKKYPPGGASRWDAIALFVNNLCKQDDPRSREECIEKYNQIARNASNKPSESSAPTTKSETTDTAGTEDWTTEQDTLLQEALSKFPATLEKNERWNSIAKAVPGKSKKMCVQRFKAIREALKKK